MAPESAERPMTPSFVLKVAAAIDVLIAIFFLTTPILSSRVGRPVTVLVAAVLAFGAAVLWVIASRFPQRRD